MKKLLIAVAALMIAGGTVCAKNKNVVIDDKIIALDQKILDANKAKILDGTFEFPQAYERLINTADELLKAKPFTVLNKKMTPPSGDKRDYTSMGPYWWPNPNTPDGRPYIRKDGVINPDMRSFDDKSIAQFKDAVMRLSLAYYITGKEKYAKKTAELLHHWFLNPETRMNPNMNFGQIVPGVNDNGRGIGMIEHYGPTYVVDAIAMIQDSKSYTAELHEGLKKWYRDFCEWWINSTNGKDEVARVNNHGTAYDAQLIAIALFADEDKTAQFIAKEFNNVRLFPQTEPDGRMPHELGRTKGLSYTLFNIRISLLAYRLAATMGIDLFDSESEDGRSLSKAIDYIAQYLGKTKEEFPYQQITHWDDTQKIMALVLISADNFYPEKKLYEKVIKSGIEFDKGSETLITGVAY